MSAWRPRAERVELEVPADCNWFEFELTVTQDRSSKSSPRSEVLAFGGSSPLAVRVTLTAWGR
jgi:hypothetical protein